MTNGSVTKGDGDRRGAARARVERAALELFRLKGFEQVTIDDVAAAAGISRRTFFRWFATKADAVWGDFDAHVGRLESLLAASDPVQPVLASVCAAYVEVNDYAADELPLLRERMQLILTEPALLAHSQLQYAEVDRVVAEHWPGAPTAPPPTCSPDSSPPPRGPPRRRRSVSGWPIRTARLAATCAAPSPSSPPASRHSPADPGSFCTESPAVSPPRR